MVVVVRDGGGGGHRPPLTRICVTFSQLSLDTERCNTTLRLHPRAGSTADVNKKKREQSLVVLCLFFFTLYRPTAGWPISLLLLTEGFTKNSTNAFLAYFLHNQVVFMWGSFRIVCTPIKNGGGEKIPSLSPVLKLTPSSLDIFMDYRRCYRGGFKMTKRMIYVGFPKNDYPIHGDSPSKLGRAFSLSMEKNG